MENLVEVGDTVMLENCFGKKSFVITRATKTLAMSVLPISGREIIFKRKISTNMSHPRDIWNLTTYKVIRFDKPTAQGE